MALATLRPRRAVGPLRTRVVYTALAVLLLLTGWPSIAGAQAPSPESSVPWYVTTAKWARWPTLAAAVGLTAAAIIVKDRANETFDGLKLVCRANAANCLIGEDGTYVQPDAERLFQETLRLDAQARRWMIGGQSFLFVSGGLFLLDLVAGNRRPKNIPFSPVEAFAAPGQIGVRWRF
jgi:hypothetical protein